MKWIPEVKKIERDRKVDSAIIKFAVRHLSNGVLVDGGAGIGGFCVPVLLATDTSCVAFEPNPAMIPLLKEMLGANNVTADVHETALTNRDSTMTLHIPSRKRQCGFATAGNLACCERKVRIWKPLEVKTETLDGLGLKDVELIKLDIEGGELLALCGGEKTIREQHPALILEAQNKNTRMFGYKVEELFELLEKWGYTYRYGTTRDLFCV